MSIKKKGLGKGLDSLIPDNKSIKSVTPDKSAEAKKEAEEKAGVQTMKINEVEPNRDQPRKNFDEDALLELSDSIKQFGVLQPLLVRKRKDYYEIIAAVLFFYVLYLKHLNSPINIVSALRISYSHYTTLH